MKPMRNARATTLVLAGILAGLLLLVAASTAHGRARASASDEATLHRPGLEDTVLAWDDGTAESETTGQSGMKLAVGFQAPVWAVSLVGIQYYIMDDNVENPANPGAPTTKPIIAYVWQPNQDMLPGLIATEEFVGEGYEEEAWLTVYLETPLDISDPDDFPDRYFFVGLEWLHRSNPIIGLDADLPIHYASFRWNWYEWEQFTGHNVMIRAIVRDYGGPGELFYIDAGGGGDFFTIQEGLTVAGRGDTVLVAPGTYTGPMNRSLGFAGRDILLISEAGRTSTIIDCEGEDRAFYFVDGETGDALVQGFTVVNGSGSGGGIRLVNSWPTIVDCVFEGCDGGGYGGGMYCTNPVSPSPTITDCVFLDNQAAVAGGGVRLDYSEAEFVRCTFAGNGAPSGGGIDCGTLSFPTFTNCIVAFGTQGGAVDCPGSGSPTFARSCVYGNAGGDDLCGIVVDILFEDPLFCDPGEGDVSLAEASPCLSENNLWGELIGARDVGCIVPVVVETRSWGAIKALFR